MLTRHFYELDEVCYALLDCLRFKKTDEAIFWGRELMLSGEYEELTKTMVQGWIMYLGVLRIDWLDAWFQTTISDNDKLSLIAEFCTIDRGTKKKMSVCALTFWIAGRGLCPEASEMRIMMALQENDPICFYWFMGSVYDKKPTAVLDLVKTYVDEPSIFDSLSLAISMKQSIHMRVLLSVCAVQLLCMESYPERFVISDSRRLLVSDLLSKWTVGYRSSRVYTINALPLGYKRVLASSLCCPALQLMDKGTAFWQTVKALIVDDDSLESMYETYFPDDIPDEWSLIDRAKSHPNKLDVYKIQIHPEFRMKKVFSSVCVIRQPWFSTLNLLFKACRVPDG
jgi:hypothetical protein